ncbi:MAG: hypothetical protein VX254_07385 [Planctomycetota bacterium]|nr:hypothetical protein [Planctomycetota bacterium]MEC9352269.1 hypothetical protein [Planctomycetota bacterium]MEE3199836.1 hypothetical protein [Planctomycetota bacterium]
MTNYTGSSAKNAYIEFGSTSIKLYIVPSAAGDSKDVERERKVPWSLGYDVFSYGRISPRTMAHCISTLKSLRQEFSGISFEDVTAVGTAALREAQNSAVFQRQLESELGLRIQIIEGGIEAFLLETGFRNMVEDFPTALFDLGGGSNELIEYLNPASTRKTSIPVGAIRLHCQLRRARTLYNYVEQGRLIVEREMRAHMPGNMPRYPEMLGTGGTVRAIVKSLGRDSFDFEDLQELIQREIHGEIWPKMPKHRRLLFLPGVLSVEVLFRTMGVQKVTYRKASVKEGLISFTSMLPAMGKPS